MMGHVWIASALHDSRWEISLTEATKIVGPALRILARYFPIGGGSSDIGLLIVALITIYGPRLMMKPEQKRQPDKGETVDAEFTDVTPV